MEDWAPPAADGDYVPGVGHTEPLGDEPKPIWRILADEEIPEHFIELIATL